jgi:hypothetical protein
MNSRRPADHPGEPRLQGMGCGREPKLDHGLLKPMARELKPRDAAGQRFGVASHARLLDPLDFPVM